MTSKWPAASNSSSSSVHRFLVVMFFRAVNLSRSPAVSFDLTLNSYPGYTFFKELTTMSVCARASFDLRVPTLNDFLCGEVDAGGAVAIVHGCNCDWIEEKNGGSSGSVGGQTAWAKESEQDTGEEENDASSTAIIMIRNCHHSTVDPVRDGQPSRR